MERFSPLLQGSLVGLQVMSTASLSIWSYMSSISTTGVWASLEFFLRSPNSFSAMFYRQKSSKWSCRVPEYNTFCSAVRLPFVPPRLSPSLRLSWMFISFDYAFLTFFFSGNHLCLVAKPAAFHIAQACAVRYRVNECHCLHPHWSLTHLSCCCALNALLAYICCHATFLPGLVPLSIFLD